MTVLKTLKVLYTVAGWSTTTEYCTINTWSKACLFLTQASPHASLPFFLLTVTLHLSFLTFVSFKNSITLDFLPIPDPSGHFVAGVGVFLYSEEGCSTFQWGNKDLSFMTSSPGIFLLLRFSLFHQCPPLLLTSPPAPTTQDNNLVIKLTINHAYHVLHNVSVPV